jgi:alanine racemase
VFDETVLRDTRAVVDLGNIAAAIAGIRERVSDGTDVMAVVKADGYGHGAVKVAKTALASGAASLGVAYPQEGAELREAGIDAPILILGLLPLEEERAIEMAVEYRLTPTVCSTEVPRILDSLSPADCPTPIHIKVDTGMGRLGVLPEDLFDYIRFLKTLKHITIEGIFTHFPSSDEANTAFTEKQIERFMALLSELSVRGIDIPKRHAANSGGVLAFPSSHLTMVRPGIMIYGLYPSKEVRRSIELSPAMSLLTRIRYLKRVGPGTPISYGRTHVTKSEALVATLPVGYADGYSRLLSNRGAILVRGNRAPIIGRVCMDMTMADVTHVPGVSIGDEVVLFGRDKDEEISIDEVAELIGTINYEVTCMVSKRVPRVYING